MIGQLVSVYKLVLDGPPSCIFGPGRGPPNPPMKSCLSQRARAVMVSIRRDGKCPGQFCKHRHIGLH